MEPEYIILDDIFLPEQIELYKNIDYIEFNKTDNEVTMTVEQLLDLIVQTVKQYYKKEGD